MIDFIGELRRIMNKDAAETFDKSTDSLEALRDWIAAAFAAAMADLTLATPGGIFSYLDAGGEQTVFTYTPTKNAIVHIIWLDLSTLTQNSTIRLKHQIDGAVYRTFETFNWTTGMDDGVYFRSIAIMVGRPLQVTMQEVANEGANRNIPYYYVYEERA